VEPINETAARWAVRVEGGSVSPDDQRELEAWLAADPRHQGAYVRARSQWVNLDRLAALHGRVEIPMSTAPAPVPETATQAEPMVSRRHLLAASVATVAVTSGAVSWRLWFGRADRYTSTIGEVRRLTLPDGSTMILNTDTEVTVRLTEQRRDIRLIHGEALFEVAHDRTRPFVVAVGDTAVRAVGTAFAVRLESDQVAVMVTDGVVEVSASANDNGADSGGLPTLPPVKKRVAANERIVIARAGPEDVRSIARAEVARQLAWREGQVSFDGETLAMAVAEINRHNRRQIVIDDPALAAMPVVGVFRATDLDGFAAAAAAALKASAVPRGDVIRLARKVPPPQN